MSYSIQFEKFIHCLDSCLSEKTNKKICRLQSKNDQELLTIRRYEVVGARRPICEIMMRIRKPSDPGKSTDVMSAADAGVVIAPLKPLLDYVGVLQSNIIGCVENCASLR